MNTSRAIVIFRITLALAILVESAFSFRSALASPTESRLARIVPWIGGIEALAAIFLLFRRTTKTAGVILLTIFAFILVVHGPIGQIYLFVYAAGIIMLMVDRPKG